MEERRISQQELLEILKEVKEQTNGGFDKRLVVLETRFQERWDKVLYELHQYSKTWAKIEDRLDTLPCASHRERFKIYDDHIEDGKFWRRFMVGQVIAISIAIITVVAGAAYSYAKVEQKIDSHISEVGVWQKKNTN